MLSLVCSCIVVVVFVVCVAADCCLFLLSSVLSLSVGVVFGVVVVRCL